MKAGNAAILDQINMVSRTQNRILAALDRLHVKPAPSGFAERPHSISDSVLQRHTAQERRVQDESES